MAALLYSLTETRTALGGVSRTTVYDLVNKGHLQLVKVGRRSFITSASVQRYVEQLSATG